MNKCENCGKPIEDNRDLCSDCYHKSYDELEEEEE
jgi:NMD protein affecting ribosome stability and mRNA decay